MNNHTPAPWKLISSSGQYPDVRSHRESQRRDRTMNALQAILNTPLPLVKNACLRKETRKVWAAEIRGLLKSLRLKGISVTTPNYSMASVIDVRIPDVIVKDKAKHEESHHEIWKRSGNSTECPACSEHWKARKHLEAIILSAFPDLDDRSDNQRDHFDYCLSVS